MKTHRVVALAALLSVTACEGLKEAMTAHVDVAARAGSQELSVQRLADMIGKAQIPIRTEVAQSVAELWVSYQLLGKAGAAGDSLADSTLVDEVMWPLYTQNRMQKWGQIISATWVADTSNLEEKYNQGVLLSARHILFPLPQGQQATGSDSVKRKAESVLKTVTAANFAALAKQYGTDATKDRGGDLGVFPRGQMVAEFEQAIVALKPGQIGPLVHTQYGYHIVRRAAYAEVKDQFRVQYDQIAKQQEQEEYVAGVKKAGKVTMKPNAAKVVKEIAANPEEHKGDRTVIATSVLGDFTAADVVKWMNAWQQPEQLRAQLQQSADSQVPMFVESLVLNELFLKQADSAKITLDTAEVKQIRSAFRALVANAWAGLRVTPTMLADSAKTKAEKEKLAAARVDAYLAQLFAQQTGFVEIPPPLANALRERYDGRTNKAGLARVVEVATKIRAVADSARAAQQPKSAVPLPGTPDTGRGRGRGGE